MYCKNCGKETPDQAELCPECSAKAEEDRKRQQAHDEWRAQMAQRLNQKSSENKKHSPVASPNVSSFCTKCGAKIDSKTAFCPSCGAQTGEVKSTPETKSEKSAAFAAPTPSVKDLIHTKKIEKFCPRCGSQDIDIQVHQEMQGSKTITRTKSKYRQKRHSIFWWLFIGWWWIFIDLFLWIAIFPIRFLIQLFKKKDYKGTSKSVEKTKNKIAYRTVFLCKNCGNHWEKQD